MHRTSTMSKYVILAISLTILAVACENAKACKLSIPESYIPTFLNPPVYGHYQKCEDKPEEKCHCVEKVDPWTADLIDGELIPNPDKKFARELAEKNARDAEKAKEEKCKTFLFKGNTIAQLRQELNDERECRK
jgi:hypothetical protein